MNCSTLVHSDHLLFSLDKEHARPCLKNISQSSLFTVLWFVSQSCLGSCRWIPFRWGWSGRANCWANWMLSICLQRSVHRITDKIAQNKAPKYIWRLGCQQCFVLYICFSCAALLSNVIIAIGVYDLFLDSHKYIISHISLSVAQFWFIKWRLAIIPFFCPFLFKRRI